MSEQSYFSRSHLIEMAGAALVAVGVSQPDAELTARSLVEADQRGISSHGLLRLPLYVAAIQEGGITARPYLRWVREQGGTAVLDAGSALGQVAMNFVVDRAIELAEEFGVAVIAVQNSVHYGAGAFWTDRLTQRGMIAVLASTTGPTVTPFGGVKKLLGTNPLTLAAPSSGSHPLTADLATSVGAYGKVVAARNEGAAIPMGWAVGPDGVVTTDASLALEGALLPFGGPKGSGISVLLEALSAGLTSASFAHETTDIWADHSSQMNTGHLLIAIDTAAFTGRKHTEDRVAQLQERIRNSGVEGSSVHAPGDIEYAKAEMQDAEVPLTNSTVVLLESLSESLNSLRPEALPSH